MLEKIRNLTILIGIYLFFTSWVYLHFYYHQFGLSAGQLKIDYSDYLSYSYEIASSTPFIIAVICFSAVSVTWYALTKKWPALESFNTIYILAAMTVAFPVLFFIAKNTARRNYEKDRNFSDSFKTVVFFFRNGAEALSPAVRLDSLPFNKEEFADDMHLIRADTANTPPPTVLRLIGESDQYYYVMNQVKADATGMLPTGYVYFVNKQDVLFTKIYLRTAKIEQ